MKNIVFKTLFIHKRDLDVYIHIFWLIIVFLDFN